MNRLLKYQNMKKVNNFFDWFKNLGGEIQSSDTGKIYEKLNEPFFSVSTFKNNATEVKSKHNYKFNI